MTAEQNRKDFPTAAWLLDQFKLFQPKVKYAEENGKSVGAKRSARILSGIRGYLVSEEI